MSQKLLRFLSSYSSNIQQLKDEPMKGLQSSIGKILGVTAVAVVSMGMFGGMAAQDVFASKGDLVSLRMEAKHHEPLVLTMGKADVVALPASVSDVLVANPNIVDVQAVQADKLYIVGLNIGDTNIIILDSMGNVIKRIDIHVTYDLDAIQAMISRLFPNEGVIVSAIHDQILLTGKVSNPEVAGRVANLVGHYVSDLQDASGKSLDQLVSNLMEVRGEQQVMLKVKIVEASRSVLKEFGIDTNANDANELAVSTIFGSTPPASTTGNINAASFGGREGLALGGDAVGAAGLFLDSGINGIGQLGLFLAALEEENLVNVLAEPNLTAVSGQQAGFLAGGEFPVPNGRDQFGNITVEYREFGVSLNFKPVVLSDKRINLQLNTEVSSLDNNNAVTLAGIVVPGLDIRRADTTVEMPSGGSLMIAGLLQSEAAKGLSSLPGVNKAPILGDLMKSESFRRDETELVVIVTAYLVEPFADKEDTDRAPAEHGELAKIFSNNVRRQYDMDDQNAFTTSDPYGYILD